MISFPQLDADKRMPCGRMFKCNGCYIESQRREERMIMAISLQKTANYILSRRGKDGGYLYY